MIIQAQRFRWLQCRYACPSELTVPFDTCFGVSFPVEEFVFFVIVHVRHLCGGHHPQQGCFCLYRLVIHSCFFSGRTPNNLVSAKGSDLPGRCLLAEFSSLVPYFPSHLQPSCRRPHVRTRTIVTFGGHEDIPKLVPFPMLLEKVLLRAIFPAPMLPMGDCIWFRSKGTTVSSIKSHYFCLRLSGLIHTRGASFPGNRNNRGASDRCACVSADTASFASPAVPGSLDTVSRNCTAAIHEAEAACIVNTALFSLSSSTLSLRTRLSPWTLPRWSLHAGIF